GIRDRNVTGVQTCALPISCDNNERNDYSRPANAAPYSLVTAGARLRAVRYRPPIATYTISLRGIPADTPTKPMPSPCVHGTIRQCILVNGRSEKPAV